MTSWSALPGLTQIEGGGAYDIGTFVEKLSLRLRSHLLTIEILIIETELEYKTCC